MNKPTIATLAASALATLTIGLAAPALAVPSGAGGNDTGGAIDYPASGQTPYGTYQNDHKARPGR